ncbi:hypothetical protein Ahy_B08g090513 [Arachis hypogaea]|uniref:Aminotransferase-like plant mobile domain-containing protein n=1 Tax=Arachis hypogaea TaxID=3818 RepID=A0A444Y089_ARAHY|nr:hypothetical protein Ahy_B08g090513 [Arachis hypogaea]
MVATTTPGFSAVPWVVLGLSSACMDIPLAVLCSTPRHDTHRRLHSAVDILDISEISALIGLTQQSRDQHEARVLRWRLAIDLLRWDEYDDPALQALSPPWFFEEAEWRTWISVVPLVYFNIVEFHQVDRVQRQFNGEQLVPGTPINVDRFLTSTRRGEDVWWPDRLDKWYAGWTVHFEEGHMIFIQPCFDYRPTREYWYWCRDACRVRYLSGQDVLDDPRLADLPADV